MKQNRIKKITATLLAILIIATAVPTVAFAAELQPQVYVSINGERISFVKYGVFPKIVDGRTLIPIKSLFEGLGAKVSYDDATRTILISRGTKSIKMTLGSKYATVNEGSTRRIIEMDIAPVIERERSLVPLKYIMEALDSHIEWNSDAYEVEIIDADYFYTQFKANPSIDIVKEMALAMEIVNEAQQDRLEAIKLQIEREYKTFFVAYKYIEKIDMLVDAGDKAELTNIRYQINASTLGTTEKADVIKYLDLAIIKLNKDIDSIALVLVVKAEKELTKESYDIALKAVYNMSYSTERTDYINRLGKILVSVTNITKYTEAEKKVAELEKTPNATNLANAKSYVNSLPSGVERDALLARIVIVEETLKVADAEKLVNIAELSKDVFDYKRAVDFVKTLKDSELKTALTKDLAAIDKEVYENLDKYAAELVEKALKDPTTENYSLAIKYIAEIKTTSTKTALEKKLLDIKVIVEVEALVIKAEQTNTQADLDIARGEVSSKITNTTILASFTARLNKVAERIEAAKLVSATAAVVKAEKTLMKNDFAVAVTAVNGLAASTSKTALVNRLLAIDNLVIANYEVYVTSLVAKAELTLLKADYDLAVAELNLVSDVDKKAALQVRLDTVSDNIAAKAVTDTVKAVEKAESTKLQADLDSARVLVNGLASGATKTDLTTRLNNLQRVINGL